MARGVVLRTPDIAGLHALVTDAVVAGTQRSAERVQNEAIRRVLRADKVDTGDLLNGIGEPDRADDADGVGYDVISTAAHSIFVELGRTPGGKMPPHAVILGWVQRRLGLTGTEADGVAWAIAHHIRDHGIAGTHFMRGAAQSVPPERLARDILDALRRRTK